MQFKTTSIGEIPSHWHVGPLRDVLNLITYGFTNPMPDSDQGPWKVTAKDVVDGRIRYETARRTTEHAYRTLLTDKSRPCIGDLLLTKDGSIGRVAVVDREGICINQSVALLRPNERVISRYLAFLLRTPYYQSRMEGDSDGSTIKHIYITRVDKMEIAIPPLSEQEEYVSLLGGVDDRIELLGQTNATLEAIAQALFKSWFIDFDPVRAKAEGREPEGMDAETAALFPSEFEDSELGAIPKGWRVGTAGDFFSITMGQSPPGKTYNQTADGLPFYQGCTDFGFRYPSQRVYCSAPTRLAKAGDVLVSVRAPVGDINIALEDCAIGRGLAAVSFDASPSFALYAMQSMKSLFAEYESHGTVFGAINKKQFESLPCVMPSAGVMTAFNSIQQPLNERVRFNEFQSRALRELRDTLLPRLISGKLRMPDAVAAFATF